MSSSSRLPDHRSALSRDPVNPLSESVRPRGKAGTPLPSSTASSSSHARADSSSSSSRSAAPPRPARDDGVPPLRVSSSFSKWEDESRGSRTDRSASAPRRSHADASPAVRSATPLSVRSSLGSSPSESLAAIQAKKQAEYDERLLANRIMRLKMEEERALRKVDETKRRAQQITEYKKRNEEITEMKKKARDEKEAARRQDMELLQRMKMQRLAAIQASRERIWEENQLAHCRVVEEKKKNRGVIESQMKETETRNRSLWRTIQSRESERRARRTAEQREKEEDAARRFQERIDSALAERTAKEKKLETMADEERTLIERLRGLQTAQRKAYETLEGALDM